MSDYDVIEKIAVISDDGIKSKEINMISWLGNSPSYDIRVWKDGEPNRKGIVLDEEEMSALYEILKERFEGESQDESGEDVTEMEEKDFFDETEDDDDPIDWEEKCKEIDQLIEKGRKAIENSKIKERERNERERSREESLRKLKTRKEEAARKAYEKERKQKIGSCLMAVVVMGIFCLLSGITWLGWVLVSIGIFVFVVENLMGW